MNRSDIIRDEALDWLVRSQDSDFADWLDFTVWLEADPAHADAYHRLAAGQAELLPLLVPDPATQDNEPRPVPRRRRLALVAGLAIASGLGAYLSVGALRAEEFLTRPGEQRTITLADGSSLVLNGGTAVSLGGWSSREVRVERGQALFRLTGTKQLEVKAGDLDLVDIGTEFEVSRDGSVTRVMVAEGAVLVDPDGARLRLGAGEQLEAADGARRLRPSAIPASAAGAWLRGQLVYLDQPLSRVVTDLNRSAGLAIQANSVTGARRFTGTLNIAEVRRDPTVLGPLLGVEVRPAGGGWVLGEGG